MLDVSAGKMRL